MGKVTDEQEGLARRLEDGAYLLRIGVRSETAHGPDAGRRMEGGAEELRRLASANEAGVPDLPHRHAALDEAARDRLDASSAARRERSLGVCRPRRRLAVPDEVAREGRAHGLTRPPAGVLNRPSVLASRHRCCRGF